MIGSIFDALRRNEDAERQNGMRRGAPHDSAMREQSAVIQALRRTSHDIGTIVPYAPAWECRSRRSASKEDAERQNGMRRGAPHDSAMREQSAVIQALRRTSHDIGIIVLYAPAWECRSRRSASKEDAERQNGMRRGASHDSEMCEQSAVIQALCRTSDDSRDYRSLRSGMTPKVGRNLWRRHG